GAQRAEGRVVGSQLFTDLPKLARQFVLAISGREHQSRYEPRLLPLRIEVVPVALEQHEVADLKFRIDTTGGIGQEQVRYTPCGQHPGRKSNNIPVVTLVQVKAPTQDSDQRPVHSSQTQRACVSDDGGRHAENLVITESISG